MTITVEATIADIALTVIDPHLQALDKEIETALEGRDWFKGITNRRGSIVAHIQTSVSPELGKGIVERLANWETLVQQPEIRLTLLNQIRAKFPQVLDLALFTPTVSRPEYRAVVQVKGDIPADMLELLHKTVAAHDPAKAPKVEAVKTDSERIAELEATVAQLLKNSSKVEKTPKS